MLEGYSCATFTVGGSTIVRCVCVVCDSVYFVSTGYRYIFYSFYFILARIIIP